MYSPMYRQDCENLKEFREMVPFGHYLKHSITVELRRYPVAFDRHLVVTKELFDKLKEKGIKVKARRIVKEGPSTVRKVIEIDSYEAFIAPDEGV